METTTCRVATGTLLIDVSWEGLSAVYPAVAEAEGNAGAVGGVCEVECNVGAAGCNVEELSPGGGAPALHLMDLLFGHIFPGVQASEHLH